MERLPLVTLAVGTALGLALGVAGTVAYDASRDDGDEPPGADHRAVDRRSRRADRAERCAPTSVILLIGDGMDDSMITAARNYSVGAAGRLVLDGLPATGAMTTYGLVPGPGPTSRSTTCRTPRRPRAGSRPA